MTSARVSLSPLAIIIMGVSGSGKSTFGPQLAARLSAPFLEGDDFHPTSNVQKMRAGIPLEDDDRWPWLDRLAEAIEATCAHSHVVVATCSALKHSYRNCLRERIHVPVLFVCLEVNRQALSARMNSRPGHFMPPALLASQLATLEVPDASEFAVCLDSKRPIIELFAQVDAMLRQLPRASVLT